MLPYSCHSPFLMVHSLLVRPGICIAPLVEDVLHTILVSKCKELFHTNIQTKSCSYLGTESGTHIPDITIDRMTFIPASSEPEAHWSRAPPRPWLKRGRGVRDESFPSGEPPCPAAPGDDRAPFPVRNPSVSLRLRSYTYIWG